MVDGIVITSSMIAGGTIFRNIWGYVENWVRTGQREGYDWKRLFATLFKVGVPTLLLVFAASAFGADIKAFEGASMAVLLDYIVSQWRHKK